MIKSFFTYLILPVVVALGLFSLFLNAQKSDIAEPAWEVQTPVSAESASSASHERVVLAVAYVSEAPEGVWSQPWANSCEEATVMMVDKYYAGAKSVSIAEAKSYILNLIAKEEERYESSRNADSMQIADMSRRFADFNAEIKTDPTLSQIKDEIKAGRPVITLHRGFDLKNPNIEFSPTLSSYHTMVVVGFDDSKKVIIAHDPGDEVKGANHEYGYDLFMNSLHDYNATDNKADGSPTVIFTFASKEI